MRQFIKKSFLKHRYFSKFLVVGTANTGVDFSIYFLLANIFYVFPVTASLVSTGITMCLSFYLNHRFVFESQKRKRHTIVQFFGVTAFNVWVVQSLVIGATLHMLDDISYFSSHIWTLNLVAKMLGIGVSLILNFLMYKYIFHKPKKVQ